MAGEISLGRADPDRYCLPIGIILGKKLAAAAVKFVAPCFVSQRMHQKHTRLRFGSIHQLRNRLEVVARLLFGPRASLCEWLQTERVIGGAVARNTPRMAHPFLDEDRLNRLFIDLVVERLPYRL